MAILRIAALIAAIASCFVPPAPAQQLSEYQVKAAFLVNFARFMEWPASAFQHATSPLVIAVIGEDPFGRELDAAIKGKVVGGHPLVARRIDWRDDARGFHLVFLSKSEKRHVPDILHGLAGSAVVTVSDVELFCKAGGVITFIDDRDRVRFEVNVDAAALHGVKISSRLLSLAIIHRNGE